MARPHIEFIYTQNLSWIENPGAWGGAHRVKLLSDDPATGEESFLAIFDDAWSGTHATLLQEELYILNGAITFGDKVMRRDGYARLPAKHRLTCSAEPGSVLAVFRNRETDAAENPVFIDTLTMRWDRSFVPDEMNFMGAAIKPLYLDPADGGLRTWLLSVAPHAIPQGTGLALETHGCAEEALMLSGDITGPHGVMSTGAYFWRPAETLHGPFGSRGGGMGLLRFREGKQSTCYHDKTLPFRFEPTYRPVFSQGWPAENASKGPDERRF